MLTTSGLPITGPTPSSTNYGNFIFCYKPDINVTCVSQSLQVIRLRVDPIVRPSVSKMGAINPAPPPTARCTYTLGTVVNPPTSTIRGEQLTRLVSLSPSSINTPGSHTIVASISHPFSGFSIQASCSSSRPDVPVSLSPNCTNPDVPECKTNAMGTVAFTVSAPQLGFADPNTSANPNANCTFQLVPGGDVSTLTLPFTNVCAGTTSASPLPAACGNPL